MLDALDPKATLHVVDGGDHSFKITRRDAAKQAAVFSDVERTIVEWVKGVMSTAG